MPVSRSIGPAGPLLPLITLIVADALFGATATAQQVPPGNLVLNPVVVSATRLPTPESEVASSVTVITADDIAAQQDRTLPQALQSVPGLNIVQTGGPGGTASVFIRGTNADHVKVLLDGIDVSDPSTVADTFDFAHLLTGNIARVEVLRGPQSGLYGSDAVGGVINIITKAGSGPPHFTGSLEGGSFGTFNQTGAASGSIGRFSYNLDVEHFHSAATPVTPTNLLAPGEKRIDDAYDNKTFGAKLGAALTDTIDVGLVTRYIDTALGETSDDFTVFPSVPAASQSNSQTRQLFTRGTLHQKLFDGAFDYTLGLGYSDDRRRDISPGSEPDYNRGDRVKLDWQGNWHLAPEQTLTFGAERQIDEIRDSPVSAQMTDNAGFVQLQSGFWGRLFDTVSLRYDGNDQFGGKLTYRVAPAVLIPETGTKLKGSVGTGFKAPSLNELYVDFPDFNFFGNPSLKPETSLGYDLGFEQTVPTTEPVKFGATWFHNDIHNLITENAAFTTNINVGQATTYGVESFVEYKPFAALSLRADYTYTIANDDILHTELLRRPRHKASLDARYQATDALSLSGTILYLGPFADISRDSTVSGLRNDGFATVNLAARYDFGNGVSLFARIDNLLDRRYQDPTGFLQPGLGVFAGIRYSFDAPALPPMRPTGL